MGENPAYFKEFYILYRGQEAEDLLRVKARGIFKNTPGNRALVAAHYREQIALMNQDPNHRLESWN
jgi:hypothetical protein